MIVEVNGQQFEAELYDNATAAALENILPMTLSMEEMNVPEAPSHGRLSTHFSQCGSALDKDRRDSPDPAHDLKSPAIYDEAFQ